MINLKRVAALFLSVVMVASMTACTSKDDGDKIVEKPDLPDESLIIDELGLAVNLPEIMYEHLGTLLFPSSLGSGAIDDVEVNGALAIDYQSDAVYQRVKELNEAGEQMTEEEYIELSKQSRSLFYVFSFKTASLEPYKSGEKNLSDVTLFEHNELVTELGENSYYLCYSDADNSNLSEDDIKLYNDMIAAIPGMKESAIVTFTPIVELKGVVPGVSLAKLDATDFDGQKVTSDIFKDYDLTLVNIWATYCTPCVDEMPILEQLSKDYKDKKIQVIGICSDTDGEKNLDKAKNIVDVTGVTYKNLIPDSFINNNLLFSITSVPTSFFVDSEGTIVGNPISGTRTLEKFKELIDNQLAK